MVSAQISLSSFPSKNATMVQFHYPDVQIHLTLRIGFLFILSKDGCYERRFVTEGWLVGQYPATRMPDQSADQNQHVTVI